MNVGLGLPSDAPASLRQQTFLPLALRDAFDAATLGGQPLVAATDTVFWIPEAGRLGGGVDWTVGAGWLLLLVGVALTAFTWTRSTRLARWADAALLLLVGAMGMVLALLWFATTHGVTGPNLNLLWAWPTHLIVAFPVARGTTGAGLRVYLFAAAAVTLAMALAAGLLTLLPGPDFPQDIPPAVFPLMLLLGLRLLVTGQRTTRSVFSTRPARAY
jgi:hypothetical protein